MNTDALKMFWHLGETRSFTLTAERIGVTQSAVSQLLTSMEREIGFVLVERSHKASRLTPEGEVCHQHCQKIVHLMESLERRMQATHAAYATAFDLMVTHSLGLHQLPNWLTSFQKKFPEVKINVRYGRNDEVHAAVMNNNVDIGLVTHPQRPPGLKVEVIQEDRLILVCHPQNPLAGRRAVRMADLKAQPFVAWKEILLIRLLKNYPEARRHLFEPLWEFEEVDLVKGMVENNNGGIAFLPETMIREEVARQRLAVVPLTDSGYRMPVAVIHWGSKKLTPEMTSFIDSLKKSGQSTRPTLDAIAKKPARSTSSYIPAPNDVRNQVRL